MAAARLLTHAGLMVLCACLTGVTAARAADAPARIALLSVGERASVVVELDDELPKATAIEAADNQSFDVEIGPVRGKVANQLLQAARQSPLVTEVRVRGVPQGPDSTLISLRVTAKTPVSGLVRRAQRRVYIDLEPLSIASDSKRTGRPMAARSEATPPSAAIRQPAPVDHPAGLSAGAAANSTAASAAIASGAISAAAAAPQPGTTVPVPTASSPAPRQTSAAADDAIQRRAELLARQSDVKSLEKLKTDWIARQASTAPGSPALDATDPVIQIIDHYLDEARKQRLLADARLFKEPKPAEAAAEAPAPSAPPPGIPADDAFQQAVAPLIPELEKMNAMLSQWQPGFVPAPSLPQSLEALTIRLRALRPPVRLSGAHERLSVALGTLAKSWVSGPDGVSLIPISPTGTDARLIMSAKAALFDYLQGVAREGLTGANRPATALD